MTDATRTPATDSESARTALRGIATFAALAREQLHRRPHGAADALRHIEQHALEVLDDAPLPEPIQPTVRRDAGEQRWPRRLTIAECAELLRDPPVELQRVPVVDVLSMVPALGPHGARRLLHRHHVARSTWLAARTWTRIADELAAEARA